MTCGARTRRVCPRASRKEDNGADRRSDHSDKTQQGAQQPAGTKNLRVVRETNVARAKQGQGLTEENPKPKGQSRVQKT